MKQSTCINCLGNLFVPVVTVLLTFDTIVPAAAAAAEG